MTYSTNGIALAIVALSYIGIEVTDVELAQFIGAIAQVIAFTVLVLNQASRWNVRNFFVKIK